MKHSSKETEYDPMDKEELLLHLNTVYSLTGDVGAVSFHPVDGNNLVELGIIRETPLAERLRELGKLPKGSRSYELDGVPVSFVPGIAKGQIVWVHKNGPVFMITSKGGRPCQNQ